MEITKETELDKILNHNNIDDIAETPINNAMRVISDRISVLQKETQEGNGLGQNTILSGSSDFNSYGKSLITDYNSILELLKEYKKQIDTKSREKEEEELIRLKNQIEKNTSALNDKISSINTQQSNEIKGYQDNNTTLTPNMIEEINVKYNNMISPIKKLVDENSTKIKEINKRLATLWTAWSSYSDAAKDNCSNIATKSEYSRRPALRKKYPTYEDYLKAMYEKYGKNSTDLKSTESDRIYASDNPELLNDIEKNSSKWIDANAGQTVITASGSGTTYKYTKDGTEYKIYTNSAGNILFLSAIAKDGHNYYYDASGNAISENTTVALTRSQDFTADPGQIVVQETELDNLASLREGRYVTNEKTTTEDVEKDYSKTWGEVKSDKEGINTYLNKSSYGEYIVTNNDNDVLYYQINTENGTLYYDNNYKRITKEQAEKLT